MPRELVQDTLLLVNGHFLDSKKYICNRNSRMPYQIILESFEGEKAHSVINSEDIDVVLREIKILLKHFRVVKVRNMNKTQYEGGVIM